MKLTLLGIVVSMLILPLTAVSQVSITTSPIGTYTQNFDGAFLSTGDYTLTDNAPANLGWYSARTIGTGNVFTASIGNAVAGQFYNYGLAADPNRALGSIATTGTGALYYGLRIQNDTASPFQSVRVQYAGEQWLDFYPATQTITFSYQVSAGDITSLTTGTFTSVTPLTFTTPSNTLIAGPLNGNLAANRVALDLTFVVAVPAGSEIMLRWQDTAEPTIAPFNHGVAIDDVTVTLSSLAPTAAHISISGRATTPDGRGISGALLVLSGGQLEQPLTARTNPFGYYQIDDVLPGSTYLLEISARRYNFTQTSLVINAQDNVTGANFMTEN